MYEVPSGPDLNVDTETTREIHESLSVPLPQGWNTLDELRTFALAAGCTPSDFKHAVDMCKSEPFKVATYVQVMLFGG